MNDTQTSSNAVTPDRILKVGSATDINRLRNGIVACYEKHPDKPILLRAIGAGALNQAIKGAIVSNDYFSRKGYTVTLVPSFHSLEGGGTGIEMRINLIRM